MNYVAVAMGNVYERRHQITNGFAIDEEAPILRHFTVKLSRIWE
jgi:tryptophanase